MWYDSSMNDQMEERIQALEKQILEINARNSRVEIEKAWETSKTRALLISALTYIVISLLMWSIGVSDPLMNALIPSCAFIVSTLSLPYAKARWKKNRD